MSLLYINENGATIGIEGNYCTVKQKDESKRLFPIESLDGITIMGQSQMTTQCSEECMQRGIPVSYFSKGGKYFGRLISTGHVNVERQRKQCALYDTDFAVMLAIKILSAKIKNQSVVLRRYEKSKGINLEEEQKMLSICRNKILTCDKIEEMIGFEGQAAKYYFRGLSACIDDNFTFQGRNKRPPVDNVNALLSFVYTLLTNMITSALETVGLDPYMGYLHTERPGRASLALDLIEELRPIFADRFVLSLINKKIVSAKDFKKKENGAVLLTDDARKRVITEWQNRKKEVLTHPYLKEKVEWGLVPYVQAMLLARHLRGDLDGYPPLLWK